MYLIVAHDDNLILGFCEEISYQSNGNVLCGDLAICTPLIKEIVEVESVPSHITPMDYAYIDREFVPVADIPPTTEEQLSDAVNALELLGYTEVENG